MTQDTRTDRDLLAAHVAGDEQAFGALFTRHRHRLWTLALRMLGNEADAADALQDALLAAWRRAGSFRGDAAVTTWLHRIVVNACLDRVRWLSSRRTEPMPEDADGRLAGWAPAASDAVEHAELRDTVQRALGLLNPDQRAAIVLVDMWGYRVEEAATLLGCAPGTIKSRCARGRAVLREALEPLREGVAL